MLQSASDKRPILLASELPEGVGAFGRFFCFWTPNCRYFDHVRYWSLWVGCRALNLSRIFGSDILFLLRPHRLVRSRTQGFHPWNRGSNPLGVMSSATPRLISRRVSFWLVWMLFVPVGLADPPIDPATLAELPEHQDPRSAEMASVLSANDWSVPATPLPWGSALAGESVALHGEVLQHGGFLTLGVILKSGLCRLNTAPSRCT